MRGRLSLALLPLAGVLLAAVPAVRPWPDLEPGQIRTVAGGRPLPASLAPGDVSFYGVAGLAADARGALYLVDKARSMVFRIEPGGAAVTPWAGALSAGFDGDGRPARGTALHVPSALALDPATGELLIADTQNHRVRAVSADGSRVTTVAGVGRRGVPPDQLGTEFPTVEGFAAGRFSGDGGPAAEAELNLPSGVAADADGLLYLSDSANHRIRAVNRGNAPRSVAGVTLAPGEIRTVAGDGTLGFAGDGGPAAAARLAYPGELELDPDGNLLVVDTFNQRVRRIDRRTGEIRTVILGKRAALDPAKAAEQWAVSIAGLAVAPGGEIVYTDRVDRSLHLLTPAGEDRVLYTARPGEAGLGSVAAGPGGEIYVADVYRNLVLRVVLRVARSGAEVAVLAGNAPVPRRVPLDQATFSVLGPVSADAQGNLYLADVFHYAVRRIVPREGMVETFFGHGVLGSRGDGGPPEEAELLHPTDVLIDGGRAVYIADQYADRVRRVSFGPDGARVDTLAGGRGERLGLPVALARHPRTGDVYVACQESGTIRRIDAGGRVVTVAGTGTPGYAGDGGPAIEARLNWPAALVFDRDGALYVSDMQNQRVRRIGADGRITTFAGTGRKGFAGDGGPADEAALDGPGGLAFDAAGNLYVADTNNHRVRRIDAGPGHRIRTVAGTGRRGFSGDGGPAAEARLNLPRGLAFGPGGVLYIVDSFNHRLRAMKPGP